MSNPSDLLNKLFSEHQGVAFGEDHRSSEIFEYLRQNVKALNDLGVKKLFIEAIHSKDNKEFQSALDAGDESAVRKYLGTRSWSNQLADDYTALVKEMHAQGIEIIGIDKPTGTQRIKESNPHWVSVIKENLKDPNDKYLILGGASHFGHVFGPGVNIDLGIPTVNFSIRPGLYADKEPAISEPAYYASQEEFQGRKVADYTIALPSQQKKIGLAAIDGARETAGKFVARIDDSRAGREGVSKGSTHAISLASNSGGEVLEKLIAQVNPAPAGLSLEAAEDARRAAQPVIHGLKETQGQSPDHPTAAPDHSSRAR